LHYYPKALGETALIGGTRVPKYHQRIEAYGTLDELNSYIGLIRDLSQDAHISSVLLQIETCLFIAESELATDSNVVINKVLPLLKESDIEMLEHEIDLMNTELPILTTFILPGGHPLSSHCHIARCICRRAERITIQLSTFVSVNELVIKYLNRLSDYLFVLARYVLLINGVLEIPWVSNPK
jgi:cob(I)alamin adenosyltransferase